jgi:altronate dehydratase small subunit
VKFYSEFFYIGKEMKSGDVDQKVIFSHPKDNVATAKSPIKAGTSLILAKNKMIAKEEIPFGHKISLRRIPKGGAVIKYGERIGRAIRSIEPGELVHIHNVIGERGKGKSRKKG